MLKFRRKTLLLVAAATIMFMVWLLYVPYRPERLLRVIPANAQLLTIHQNLATRWPAMLQNPVLQSLAMSVGVDAFALRTLATDAETLRWVQRLAAHDTALAYIPHIGASGRPAWVLASWLGGDSQKLRLQLLWFPPPGFTRHAPHNGVPYWTVNVPGLKPGVQLALAFVEGMVIATLGDDSSAILELLDSSDGILPSLASARGAKFSDYQCLAPSAPDHGWVDTGALVQRKPNTPVPPPLTMSLTAVEPHYAEGNLCGPLPLPAAKTSAKPMEAGDLVKLTGNLPMVAALIRTETALPSLETILGPAWKDELNAALQLQHADRIALFLMGGDYGGRLYGFRIPALIAGFPVRAGEAMPGLLHGVLDRLNTQRGWGLIPREIKIGNHTLYAVEGTRQNAFSLLPPEELPAYTVCDNWFLVASSLRALTALVARYDRPEAAEQAGTARWTDGLDIARGGAYGWVDFARARDELRLIIAGYSLKLMLDDPRKAAGQRQQLNTYKAWLDALAPLGQAKLWLTSDGQLSALRFEIGKSSK
ncbi:MAG: hypothetical protein EPN23_04325 [Verrucomicrobia bacterium]|nr:MAG: hypothetical protein EPN23_04325 [Verrucomicrobiota bacterium]